MKPEGTNGKVPYASILIPIRSSPNVRMSGLPILSITYPMRGEKRRPASEYIL